MSGKLASFASISPVLTCSELHTRALALGFGVKAITVPAAASVPELRAGISLLVVVPADDIFAAGALV